MVEYRKMIYREDLRNEPDSFFLFGDNLHKYGYGGQAREMRDEPNAIGIPTKRKPSSTEDSYFSDDDYFEAVYYIDIEFNKIPPNSKVIVPEDGLGTGLAELPQRSPLIYNYILDKIAELNVDKPISSNCNVYKLIIEHYNPWAKEDIAFSGFYTSKEKCRKVIYNWCDGLDTICSVNEFFCLINNNSLYEGKEQYIIKSIDDDVIHYNCYIKKLKIN